MDNHWHVTLNLGEKIPGKELLPLLEKIDETGSLKRAVEEAGISYRYGWSLLKRAEDALGKELVARQTGGSSGGGTTLTVEGRLLLGHMQILQREVAGQLAALLGEQTSSQTKNLLLASTMEPVITGLLDVIEHMYLQETGVTVRHIAAGSGQALAMARAGRVDAVLTHAPQLEEQLVRDGWGCRRIPIMTNEMVIVGPSADPARVCKISTAVAVLQRIAQTGAIFVSRADQSGTHLFEQKIWRKADIDPVGLPWYREMMSTLGSYGILRHAAECNAYTLVDRASFVTGRQESQEILLQGDETMQNVFSIIAISRQKAPVQQESAERFASWLLTDAVQNIIGNFGQQQYGLSLFESMR
ncbi:MAG: substrate-binding domain-containing protein [Firmicutes bacterium]|nr:substrate-binding domain-containing protein [Bacillota bacterium]